jgi:2-pyrone-4,6-dicarboxylate lactonase
MRTRFTTTPGWLEYDAAPSRPTYTLPPGTVDAHCHVFGPGDIFPFAPERRYTPCDAGKEQLFALRDHLGVTRNVIVQATCHGADNSAMVDAVRASGGRARGVATVHPDVGAGELRELDSAGVRGVRFNFVKRLVDAAPKDELAAVAAKIAPWAGTSSSTSRAPTCRSWRASSARCPPRWWSTTWDART